MRRVSIALSGHWQVNSFKVTRHLCFKKAKICVFLTFWPVIQLINHIYGALGKKGFCRILLMNYRRKCLEDADFCFFFGSIRV